MHIMSKNTNKFQALYNNQLVQMHSCNSSQAKNDLIGHNSDFFY